MPRKGGSVTENKTQIDDAAARTGSKSDLMPLLDSKWWITTEQIEMFRKHLHEDVYKNTKSEFGYHCTTDQICDLAKYALLSMGRI